MTWEIWLAGLIIVIGAFACVVPLMLVRRLHLHIAAWHHSSPVDDAELPATLVILPCKGDPDELPELAANLQPVLEQVYPNYRVVFALGDEQDIALPIIRNLCAKYDRASVVVAEPERLCSQKISNQLRGLTELQSDDRVIVFLDSDARPDATLLRRLVAPLADKRIGVTTGFRWYTPRRGGFASWLRAAWNAGGMPMLVDPKLNYAWGGAMAVRREVFEQCDVGGYWREALSDDLGLSAVVKQAGYRIHFVPDCLVDSPEDLPFGRVLEWTTRQTIICRVYNPRMWRDIFVGEAMTTAIWLGAVVCGVIGVATTRPTLAWVGLAVAVGMLLVRMLYQASILRAVRQLAPRLLPPGAAWKLIVLSPLVTPLILWNSLVAALSRRITWRGIHYTLKGPREIVVNESE